jgi:hypothetical protein
MGEDNTDRRLSLTDMLRGCRPGIGGLPDIAMELFQIVPSCVLAFELRNRHERGIGRA